MEEENTSNFAGGQALIPHYLREVKPHNGNILDNFTAKTFGCLLWGEFNGIVSMTSKGRNSVSVHFYLPLICIAQSS